MDIDMHGNSDEGEKAKVEIPEEDQPKNTINLTFAHDIPMKITVELGQLELKIREIMKIKSGTVLEIEKLAGEPLEILLNDRHVARGEVIVLNEKYGIRLTDIIKTDDSSDGTTGNIE